MMPFMSPTLTPEAFAAYGWPAGLTDEEILQRLLALNLARAGVKPVT